MFPVIGELGIFVWVLYRPVGYFFVGRRNLRGKLGEGGAFLLFVEIGWLSFGRLTGVLRTLLASGAPLGRWIF